MGTMAVKKKKINKGNIINIKMHVKQHSKKLLLLLLFLISHF